MNSHSKHSTAFFPKSALECLLLLSINLFLTPAPVLWSGFFIYLKCAKVPVTMSIFSKLFGGDHTASVKRFEPIVAQINAFEPKRKPLNSKRRSKMRETRKVLI